MKHIKHLVFSGGGPSFLQMVGAMQYIMHNGNFDFQQIKSIYATSAGAFLGVILCMQFDWDTIIDYIVKRPWQEIFIFQIQQLFSAYQARGIFDKKIIEKIFFPLFAAKDIPYNITLTDFFRLNNIELHFFTFDINQFQTVDISHLSYPNLPLIDALHMTASIPVLMCPIIFDGKCFIDGGLCANYPMSYCIKDVEANGGSIHEILGFKNIYWEEKNEIQTTITPDSTIVDFLICIFLKILHHFTNTSSIHPILPNEIACNVHVLSLPYLQTFWESSELRKKYIIKGAKNAQDFLTKH